MSDNINLVVSDGQFFDRATGELYTPEDVGFALRRVLYELSTIVTFGKHKGKSVQSVIDNDPTYIYWMFDKQFNLSSEVIKASNKRTAERKAHASKVSQVRSYPSVMFDGNKLITGIEQGIKDIKRDMDNRFFER